ncbi:MAG: LysM peptidoglycan-binding domain-containing protein, partial [Anaerolineae bacterium]
TASATPERQIHVVQQGDTLGGIAVRYQVDSAIIAQANGLYLTSVLSIGQELVIPGVAAEPTPTTTEALAPTAAPQVSATPTPFQYRTRQVSFAYRQPRLLTPVNGAVLLGAESAPVLQWTSVGILKGDEWYQVRLWTPDGGTEAEIYRTRATSWRLSTDLYPESRRGERFLWDVTVVRVTEGARDAEELSLTSKQRAFRWR